MVDCVETRSGSEKECISVERGGRARGIETLGTSR